MINLILPMASTDLEEHCECEGSNDKCHWDGSIAQRDEDWKRVQILLEVLDAIYVLDQESMQGKMAAEAYRKIKAMGYAETYE